MSRRQIEDSSSAPTKPQRLLGKSWLERMLLGGVAVTVLRNATCPVLSVKTPSSPIEPSHTAVGPDAGAN
jgi:nucleotide-binding universal stress UspA family protein